jgi:hypothetical protein
MGRTLRICLLATMVVAIVGLALVMARAQNVSPAAPAAEPKADPAKDIEAICNPPPSQTVEDSILSMLIIVSQKMDEDLTNQQRHITELSGGSIGEFAKSPPHEQTSPAERASVDVESQKLHRLIEKRTQMFDMIKWIVSNYADAAGRATGGVSGFAPWNPERSAPTDSGPDTKQDAKKESPKADPSAIAGLDDASWRDLLRDQTFRLRMAKLIEDARKEDTPRGKPVAKAKKGPAERSTARGNEVETGVQVGIGVLERQRMRKEGGKERRGEGSDRMRMMGPGGFSFPGSR